MVLWQTITFFTAAVHSLVGNSSHLPYFLYITPSPIHSVFRMYLISDPTFSILSRWHKHFVLIILLSVTRFCVLWILVSSYAPNSKQFSFKQHFNYVLISIVYFQKYMYLNFVLIGGKKLLKFKKLMQHFKTKFHLWLGFKTKNIFPKISRKRIKYLIKFEFPVFDL